MDVLSDILNSIQLRGGVRFRCELTAPWGMAMRESPSAEFHIVVRGSCWLRVAGRTQPVALQGGDLIAFLHGASHRLADAPGRAARPVEKLLARKNLEHYGPLIHGGGGLPASILCGYFEFDRESLHPLVAALPSFIHLRGTDSSEFAWLQTALNFMIHETRTARPGAKAVVNRLAGVLFVQMVRAYLEQSNSPPGMLAAIGDKQIGAVLELMHQSPDHSWTLEALARRAAISRSALAVRFLQLTGQTPIQYLTLWRMQLARRLLRETALSTAAVAERAGYLSEAAFGKAFKKIVGQGPGAYRRKSSPRNRPAKRE